MQPATCNLALISQQCTNSQLFNTYPGEDCELHVALTNKYVYQSRKSTQIQQKEKF